jgi:hypothetical protein
MSEILSSAGQLVFLALFFVAMAVIGFVGVTLRRAYEYSRRGYSGKARSSCLLGILGLVVIAGIGYGLYYLTSSPTCMGIYGIGILVLLILGWSGRLVVPEGLADDREDLERPIGYKGQTPPSVWKPPTSRK